MECKFRSLSPLLQTGDMERAIRWYESVLGFKCVGREGDDWCRLERGRVMIMFMRNAHLGAPHATATQYIYVENVLGLWDSIKDKVTVEWGPEEMPYGMMEFAIKDPDGYLLSFGQELEPPQEY
jgi:uncharacterized glyoxalase superfamily protein PhnB